MKPTSGAPGSTRWSRRLLYAGVALFLVLAAFTVHAFLRQGRERTGQVRAETLFDLVAEKTPLRPTEAPGVSAWLNLELKRYRARITDPERARLYGEVAAWEDRRSVPPFFAGIRELLSSPVEPPPPGTRPRLAAPAELGEDSTSAGGSPLQFRSQGFVEHSGHWLVVTRRRALEGGDLAAPATASDRFLAAASPHLVRLAERLAAALAERSLPSTPGPSPPRVVRLYALAEDSTLVSIPVEELAAGPEERRRIALAEGREFRKLPLLPNFVSNEFFFQFDFREPRRQVHYSGLYLDLAGEGVVASVTVPVVDPPTGLVGVLGADITFEIDWSGFAAQLEPPLLAAVVDLPPSREERWRPWTEIEGALPAAARPPLGRAVAFLADRERREGLFASSWYAQHGSVPGQGAVAALQVAARTWLVVLFPKSAPRPPLLPMGLLLATAVLLAAGFEAHRRQAEREKVTAEREKLSGLLSHGVDTLARVLARLLRREEAASDAHPFTGWLAGYVERRIRVTAWLLHRWDAEPPLPPACSIEADQALETLAALSRVFALVRADPELRSSLHWDNGVLAGTAGPVLAWRIDWPAGTWFPLPVAGGFGLFLGEVLINAVRHGRPSSVVDLAIVLDRGRRELLFAVENETPVETAAVPARPPRLEPYGGRRILERLARLFGWQGLAFEQAGGRFRVTWRVPVSDRGEPGRAD